MDKVDDEQANGYTEIYSWGADRFGQLGLGNKIGSRNYITPTFYSFNVIITQISAGEEHTAFITSYGTIFTMGSNSEGRLGIGEKTIKQSSSPCLVESLSKLSARNISCGWGHTAAIFSNGEIYTWGVGEYGALGISMNTSQWMPVKVKFSSKDKVMISNLSAGTRHTAVIDERGKLYTFGSGDAGQLGTGSRKKEETPFQISSINEKLLSVSCGVFHTLVLSDSGRVFGMGGNNFGQLGLGTKRSSTVPIKIQELENIKITQISAGQFSSAVSESGDLYVWGHCTLGEFLKPKKIECPGIKFANVSLGGTIGIAIDLNGLAFGWGTNSLGELGLGDYEQRKELCSLGLLKDKKIIKISVGGSYCIAIGKTVSKQNSDLSKRSIENTARIVDKSPSILSKHIYDHSSILQNDKSGNNLNLSRISKNVKEENISGYQNNNKESSILKDYHDADFPRLTNYNRQRTPISNTSQLKIEENSKIMKSNFEYVNSLLSQRDQLMDELKKEKQKNSQLQSNMNINSYRKEKKISDQLTNPENEVIILGGEIKTLEEKCKLMENEKKILEENLISSQNNFQNLTREMENAKENISALNNQIKEMNNLMNEQETENATLKEEHKIMLKDFSNKDLRKEEGSANQIINHQTNEIDKLKDELRNSNLLLEKKEKELKDLQEIYQTEIGNLSNKINNLSNTYEKEKEEKFVEKENEEYLKNLENLSKLKIENNELKDKIEQYTQTMNTEKSNLSKINSDYIELQSMLEYKENEINALKKSLEDQNNAFFELKSEFNAICENSENMETLLSENNILKNSNFSLKKESEVIIKKNRYLGDQNANLQSEVVSLNQISSSLSKENSDLKRKCEIIEEKNKKLIETLNSHLYSKAAEYKEKSIKQLKESLSPKKFQTILNSSSGIPYQKLSPIRLKEIIKEENSKNDQKLNINSELISSSKNFRKANEHLNMSNVNELSNSIDSSNRNYNANESRYLLNQEAKTNFKNKYNLVDSISSNTIDFVPKKVEIDTSRNIVQKPAIHTPSLATFKKEIYDKNISIGEISTGKSRTFLEMKNMKLKEFKKQDVGSNSSKFDIYKIKPGRQEDLSVAKSSFNLSILNSKSIRENISNLKNELSLLHEDRNLVYDKTLNSDTNSNQKK